MTISDYSNQIGIDPYNRSRKPRYLFARYAIYYKLKQQGYGLVKIGRLFGYTHAAVHNGIKQFKNLLETKDPIAIGYWEKIESL